MTADAFLDRYLEGWRTGDAELSLGATAPGFYYDDPATGRVARGGFVDFVEAFKADGTAIAGGTLPAPFLTYSDVIRADTSPGTAWCWWRVTGTDFQGTALIRFDDSGILSERIAYFTGNPEPTAIPG